MKKHLKMTGSLVALALSAVMLVSACGETSAPATGSTSGQSSSSGSTGPKPGELAPGEGTWKNYGDVRLTMLHAWNGSGQGQSKVDWVNSRVYKDIREKIGVTVVIEGIMMNETEKLNLVFASGDMPDFIDCAYWPSPSGENTVIKKAATEGLLLPIDDYFDDFPDLRRAYEIGVISEKFKTVDVEDPIFEGKHYVLPMESPGNANNIQRWGYGLTIRGDIPGKLGFKPTDIHTTEDIYQMLVKIKNSDITDINGTPVIPLSTSHNGWSLDQATHGLDQQYFTNYRKGADGKTSFVFFEQPYMDKVLFIRKLVSEGLVDVECFKHSSAQFDAKNATGLIAVYGAMFGRGTQRESTILETNPEFAFEPLGPLYLKDGSTFSQLELNGRDGTHVWVFPKTNKNLEATLAYITYINSKEGQILTRYGYEGETFEYNAQGQPRRLKSLIEKGQSEDSAVREELAQWYRDLGVGQYNIRYADLSMDWFGEMGPGWLEGRWPEEEKFEKDNIRPLKLVDGFPVSGVVGFYPRVQEFNTLMGGERERETRERAYFASTDKEAQAIMEEYFNYLRTAENGVLLDLLKYIDEQIPKRNDWLY